MNRVSISKKKIPLALLLVGYFLLRSLFLPTQAHAQYHGLYGQIDGNPHFLILGDRVNITMKISTEGNKLLTQDRKYHLQIRNSKNGQTCQTTDNTLKDDGTIQGYCEAKGDSGNMEIAVDPDDNSSFSVNGSEYGPWLIETYNAMFNDPKQACQGGVTTPTAFTLVKQNDITVKADWQLPSTFVGSYDVLYGNTLGQYPSKRTTAQNSLIIDGLDSSKDYYFKIQANSACKWTASSLILKYSPRTGGVSGVSEKPLSSPSPSIKPKVTFAPTRLPSLTQVASPDASVSPSIQPSPTDIPMVSPTPTPRIAPTQISFPAKIWQAVMSFFDSLRDFGKK